MWAYGHLWAHMSKSDMPRFEGQRYSHPARHLKKRSIASAPGRRAHIREEMQKAVGPVRRVGLGLRSSRMAGLLQVNESLCQGVNSNTFATFL